MEQALAMQAKVENCQYNYANPTTSTTTPPVSGSVYTYPDMSGYCG
jgi:hypothetical protein